MRTPLIRPAKVTKIAILPEIVPPRTPLLHLGTINKMYLARDSESRAESRNARCLTCSPSIVLCADHMHYNHMKFSPFHDYQLFSETKHVYTDFQLPEVTLSAGWACDTNCVISYQSVRLLKDAGSIIIFIFTLFTLL